MKHIVIDARLYGPQHTGLGRYTKNLLISLKNLSSFKKYIFTLLVYPELREEIENDLGSSFNYISTNLRHYSLKEQIFLPKLLSNLKPNLVHFTHLDKAIFYPGASIVTVHDLIRHFSKGPNTTTKSPLLYWPKYWGYLFMTRIILATSNIIVPSNFWRDYIIKKYNYDEKKIITTYEAVDSEFFQSKINSQASEKIEDYIIYTGNLYPHKNINIILKALKKLPHLKLKIICARSVFTKIIEKEIINNKLEKQVEFLGYIKDSEFVEIYQKATALVHPSFLEGFSLTGLEAMALSCPVISAKSSCLPEIYEDSVLYFNPNDSNSLVKQINKLQKSTELRKKLIKLGHLQISKYSWTKCANETMSFYENIINGKS